MKTMKLEFYEKKTQKRSDGSPITLEFRGNWENNGLMPAVKLTFTGCDQETADTILNGLELAAPGEFLFLNKGVNPQRKLDDWLGKAVKRKSPKVEDFVTEVADFTEDEKKARYELLFQDLELAVKDGREDSKKFEFLFECLQRLGKEIWGLSMTKEGFVNNIRKPQTEYEEDAKLEFQEPEPEPELAEDPTHPESEEDDTWEE